jgi:MinD-like ATPase involved in chromosome partitioning or flagellar assembly
VSGRQDEPAPRSDATWAPNPAPAEPSSSGPHHQIQLDAETHDFGPLPTSSHLEEESRTDSAPHPPAEQVPPQAAGQQSGPYPVAEHPGQQSGPYPVAGGPSGPYAVGGGPSGPQYVDPSAGSGPYRVPQYADPSTSGRYGVSQYPQPMRPVYPPQQPYQQHPSAVRPQQVDPRGRGPVHADELSSQRLLKQAKRKPQSGWRKAVWVATGHLINPGESPSDTHRRELIGRVNQPLRGCYKIAMLSLKGGVGKTTVTTTLGSTFSSLRGDRVIAVDANPDRGTLSQKIPLETTATVRHLLRDADRIKRYSDIRAYTSQGPSRLEVLASEQDPAVSEAFSEDDYRRTIALLEHFYNIVLTDCGTGLMHSAMKGVLDLADSLVIVSSGSVDGARSASATLDWLDVHGYRDLVSRSVAVINSVRPKAGSVNLDKLAQHFGARCRAVCRIPFDPHLEEGAEIELDRLSPETRLALLEMAATVADAFPSDLKR